MYKTAKVDLSKPLPPGIYDASRRIAAGSGGFWDIRTPFGVHRFLVMIPRDPEKFKGKLTDIGNGQKGIIVGARNRSQGFLKPRALKYHRNSPSDISAIKEALKNKAEGKGHWETTVRKVIRNRKEYTDKEIAEILEKARNFRAKTRKEVQKYPGLLTNMLGKGENSNSFIASLLDYSGHAQKELQMNVPGYDAGSNLRLPKELFTGTPKTAAEVIGLDKEAISWEELKDKVRSTDPRVWTTPMGTAAGVALMHALGDPGKRSRMRYLLAGLAGTGAGLGTGQALKTYSPFFNPAVDKAMDAAEQQNRAGLLISQLSDDTDPEKGRAAIAQYMYSRPETLTSDADKETWNKAMTWLAKNDPRFKDVIDRSDTEGLIGDVNRYTLHGLLGVDHKMNTIREMEDTYNRAVTKAKLAEILEPSLKTMLGDKYKGRFAESLAKAKTYGSEKGFDIEDSPIYGINAKMNRMRLKNNLGGGVIAGPLAYGIKTVAGKLGDMFVEGR